MFRRCFLIGGLAYFHPTPVSADKHVPHKGRDPKINFRVIGSTDFKLFMYCCHKDVLCHAGRIVPRNRSTTFDSSLHFNNNPTVGLLQEIFKNFSKKVIIFWVSCRFSPYMVFLIKFLPNIRRNKEISFSVNRVVPLAVRAASLTGGRYYGSTANKIHASSCQQAAE
jgi:hypothetical protein